MNEIITRKEAIERGLTRYRTGLPCKRGHLVDRWVSNGQCVQCKRELLRAIYATPKGRQKQIEWSRRWQREHREHWNEYQKRRNRAKKQDLPQSTENEKSDPST